MNKVSIVLLFLFSVGILVQPCSAQQINIARIEQIPNFPQPYEMRDWRKVALGYDSLVFDLQAQGDYLPLIWQDPSGVNYPNHSRFGFDSYVGTMASNSAEAINVLPAVISASLVGIDKSNQNGTNWVLMSEDFFNNRSEENVYLNNYVTSSGNDWWYDTMPNIFFYQLYDLYPGQGDFERQFISVADRWLEAVDIMGGGQTPWAVPQMNYRAWKLATMTPLTAGVRQPEAAGAIAWILYNAYIKTSLDKYRIGAEWALEFLNSRTQNPAYELQLPYGVYVAARMNAELNTDYDIEKLLNWCFTPDGNVREWGMVLGNWGGYDCDGLIGEAVYDGYAFIMNGFQQMGALVPMVKYDERFARAIGKWVLNCANASRLFYSKYLPDNHQDSEQWSKEYDKNSVIAYESLREFALFSDTSPYATGDAMRGGWGYTNLALYGSSHMGIMGGIVDTTNVEGVLQLDMNKTDFFNNRFPTYLYYNPHEQSKEVTILLPEGSFDLYESISNVVISTAVSGSASITIPLDEAIILVLVPSGSTFTYQLNKTIVDGLVIDYNSDLTIENYPPRIKSLKALSDKISISDTVSIYCTAHDPDADALDYSWIVSAGSIENTSTVIASWIAPENTGDFLISCIISDPSGGTDSSSIIINVTDNHAPVINNIFAESDIADPGQNVLLTCQAHDEDDDPLTYTWRNESGDSLGSGSVYNWTAPEAPGYYILTCIVKDTSAETASDVVGISVGDLVVYLPFTGNADDSSGFLNSGIISGALSVTDRNGNANAAVRFDSNNDYILIENHESINFKNAITVHFWMRADTLYNDKEMYPISHGNWENRWKVSLSNGKLRWTVNTTNAIRDLDSQVSINIKNYYAVSCTYDGSKMDFYINGILSSTTTQSGSILTTSYDLIVGQVLPDNYNYGFNGILDDIRIYNRALDDTEILAIYNLETALRDDLILPVTTQLYQNFPNPFNPQTNIKFSLNSNGKIKLDVFDINGIKVASIFNGIKTSGTHIINWNAKNLASGVYFTRMSTKEINLVRKIIKLK